MDFALLRKDFVVAPLFDDPFSPNRNGLAHLSVALETHYPLDLLIIMLGTNDLKANFNLSAFDISRGAASLLVAARNFSPKIQQTSSDLARGRP